MKRSTADHLDCSIARSLEILGEWWTLLIIRDVFFGMRRFDEFVADLGISRGVLTDRLATLVDHEVLTKVRYQQRPDRFEYRLTDKGRDLFPVLMSLLEWGDKWLVPDTAAGPTVVVEHHRCGHSVTGSYLCSSCGQSAAHRDVILKAGPGSAPNTTPHQITTGTNHQ